MKKVLSFILVMVLVLLPLATFAVISPENPDPEPEIEEIIEEHQTVYRLTIYYVYLDGTTAAETYYAQLDAGTEYSVPSPYIAGYTPTMEVVSGTMPARDVEWTVIYIPQPGDTPEDNDEPGDNGEPENEPENKAETPENPIQYFNSDNLIITIEDLETPLGLGASIMNVGICVE